MKNKKLFSMPIIVETIKQSWFLPMVATVIYVLSMIIPVLSKKQLITTDHYFTMALLNVNIAHTPMVILIPLIAAILVLSFVHKENKNLFVTALPLNKSCIFNSYVLSGLILILAPVIIVFIIISLLLSGVVMPAGSATAFTWLIDTFTMEIFFYGLFILAGFIAASSVMHLLISGVLFVFIPAITFAFHCYYSTFIPGYAGMTDLMERLIFETNPIFYMFSCLGPFSYKRILAYIAVALVFISLARLLYQKIKSEKTGDSVFFSIAEEIITCLVAFLGATLCAFVSYFFGTYMGKANSTFIIGMILGGLIAFLVSKIIFARSIKVFGKKFFITLLIFVVIMCIFVSISVYDILGYSDRIPEADQIESVILNAVLPAYGLGDFSYDTVDTSNPIAIQNVLNLHRHIVSNKLYQSDNEMNLSDTTERPFHFNYVMKDGTTFDRYFDVKIDEKTIELCEKVLEDLKTFGYYDIEISNDPNLVQPANCTIEIYVDGQYAEHYLESKEDILGLIEAKNKDIQLATFRDVLYNQNKVSVASVALHYFPSLNPSEYEEALIRVGLDEKDIEPSKKAELLGDYLRERGSSTRSYYFSIYNTDLNLIAYLKDLGYI